MTPLEQLRDAIEQYAMPNRIGDASELAIYIDKLIMARIGEIIERAALGGSNGKT